MSRDKKWILQTELQSDSTYVIKVSCFEFITNACIKMVGDMRAILLNLYESTEANMQVYVAWIPRFFFIGLQVQSHYI